MNYLIRHESQHRIRLELLCGRMTASQFEVLEYALQHLKGVTDVTVFRETNGVALTYTGDRDVILQKITDLRFENVQLFARDLDRTIDAEEVRRRKLDPELKTKLRTKILIEMVADVFLPMPLQVAYHMYQLITLKGL